MLSICIVLMDDVLTVSVPILPIKPRGETLIIEIVVVSRNSQNMLCIILGHFGLCLDHVGPFCVIFVDLTMPHRVFSPVEKKLCGVWSGLQSVFPDEKKLCGIHNFFFPR